MIPLTLSKSQARRFLLAHQALWPPRNLMGKAGALDFIRRVGCIQFDPLDMAGQNADLVLQARVADFTPGMLRQLLYEDRKLLDGWDKMMAIYPVEDWPYLRRRRENARSEFRSIEAVEKIAPAIRAEIEQRGPLSSLDLEHSEKVAWWWSPTSLSRAALESMYLGGELIVHHKVHTRKIYDLASRHIPAEIFDMPEPNPTDADYREWYVLRRLGSVGLLWNRGGYTWVGVRLASAGRKAVFERLEDKGKIIPVQVEDVKFPLYLRAQDKALLEEILQTDEPAQPTAESALRAAFIAPLDNLVWERSLIEVLFDFDYRWEVYTPPARRKYGYYVLPVLYGDRFVGRVEPVRQKKNGLLTIKNWWWEPDVTPDEAMLNAIQTCFEHFCGYLGIQQIEYGGQPVDLAEISRRLN